MNYRRDNQFALKKKQIKITPKLKEPIDLDRLVDALLELVDSLPQEEIDRLAEDGEKLLKKLKDEKKKKTA